MSKISKIVLDTNFLMIPAQFGVDIFEDIQKRLNWPVTFHTCSGSIKELKKLEETASGKDKTAAKIAQQLVKRKKVKIIETYDRYVDTCLVELSEKGYLVATADIGLQKKLNNYIYLRQRKYIELKGDMD